VHFKRHADTPKLGTKEVKETNNRTPNLMFRSFIGTYNNRQTSKPQTSTTLP